METEEQLIKRLNEWKDNVESKGMRVTMNKTKVMISGERQKVRQKAVRWPCRVCSKGVGSNSLQCTSCQKLVHKKCSGIKGSISKVTKSFICRGCLNLVTSAGRTSVWILGPVQKNLNLNKNPLPLPMVCSCSLNPETNLRSDKNLQFGKSILLLPQLPFITIQDKLH